MVDREKLMTTLQYRINEARNKGSKVTTIFTSTLSDCMTLLKEQEAKTGYWIDSAGNDKCSICGAEYSDLYPDYGNTPFCPNCGAKNGRSVK